MELYPAGLLPASYPEFDEAPLQEQPRKRRLGCSQEAREAALVLPSQQTACSRARQPETGVAQCESSEDEMELLERILRECRISDDGDAAGNAAASTTMAMTPGTASSSSAQLPSHVAARGGRAAAVEDTFAGKVHHLRLKWPFWQRLGEARHQR
eukprot:TRINITY_DN15111_c0_g1_i1.p1 TRINITY_DN15111_c0_g1~~TRINITY_DN15111_c0_g1_i1.p1  ORF type:complete len:155 (+),score=34.56 TRINITY_DN15111_c0_g1_i1:110-574(+)